MLMLFFDSGEEDRSHSALELRSNHFSFMVFHPRPQDRTSYPVMMDDCSLRIELRFI